MRALLATNFWADEVRDRIVPALAKHVEVVGVVSAEHDSPFSERIDRLRPDVVFLMNEIVSHSTSYRLANVCREKGVKLAVLSKQKAGWPALVAKLAPPEESFGTQLRREREAIGMSYHTLSTRCCVSKEVVRLWEEDKAIPSRQEFKRLRGSIRAMGAHPPKRYAGDIVIVVEEGDRPDLLAQAAPETFGAALARAREREGLVQEELAELVGVRRAAVGAWERDESVPVRAHYDILLVLLPELVLAPVPPVQDIDKPDGGAGFERPSTATHEPEEEPTMVALANPVLRPADVHPPRVSEVERAEKGAWARVDELEAELVRLHLELETARAESVAGSAEALRRLVRAGFLTEAEAAEKWAARIR